MRIQASRNPLPIFAQWSLGLLAIGLAAAPWCRNRGYLRELLDYGIMMAAAGRLESGQRPYVDFGTPLQSASLWFNWAAERLFGGTYLAMTWGNILLMTLGFVTLHYLIRRRFSRGLSLLLPWVIIVASAGQHTIIWYNAVGTIALAVATWAAATRPIIGRKHWVTTALACVALVIGGCNKLNFHLVTLAVVSGWTIRAIILNRAQWRNGVWTLIIWGCAGVVVPLGIELGWTGASIDLWKHNVIDLAVQNRGELLAALTRLDFYLHPIHDYYGPVLKPAGGIIFLILLLTGIIAWKNRSAIDRGILIVALLCGLVASELILASNLEIVYVALATALAIICSLWLGFGIALEQRLPWSTLWIFAGIVGIHAWISAWHGQRMLYGNHSGDRQEYRALAPENPQFDYFTKVKFAPESATAIETFFSTYQTSSQVLQRPAQVFFTRGLEGLYRISSISPPLGLPLWISGVCYGPQEIAQLHQHLTPPSTFDLVVEQPSWNYWPIGIREVVERLARLENQGIYKVHHLTASPLPNGLKPVDDPIGAQQIFGGNLDSQQVRFDAPLWSHESKDGTIFLGTDSARGSFNFQLSVNRVETKWFIRRSSKSPDDDAVEFDARLSVESWSHESEEPDQEIWSADIKIPTGTLELSDSVGIDAGNRRLRFKVEIPAEAVGRITAGWQLPTITHSAAITDEPPQLRPAPETKVELSTEQLTSLFGSVPESGTRVILLSGRIIDNQIKVDRGGQVWFRASEPWAHLKINIVAPKSPSNQLESVARMLWYEGGRLQILKQAGIPAGEIGENFHGWPAEDFGWFGLLVDATSAGPPIYLRLDSLHP